MEPEGYLPNVGDTVGDGYARQTTARIESAISNGSHRFSIVAKWNNQIAFKAFITAGDGDAVAFDLVGEGGWF